MRQVRPGGVLRQVERSGLCRRQEGARRRSGRPTERGGERGAITEAAFGGYLLHEQAALLQQKLRPFTASLRDEAAQRHSRRILVGFGQSSAVHPDGGRKLADT